LQVSVRDYDNKTPLHYASINGRDEIFEFLVNRGKDDIHWRLFVLANISQLFTVQVRILMLGTEWEPHLYTLLLGELSKQI
jgi:ankyrin repeat protein